MSRAIMFIPIHPNIGLTSIMLGIIKCFKEENLNINLYKPVTQLKCNETKFNKLDFTYNKIIDKYNSSIFVKKLKSILFSCKEEKLLEKIFIKYNKNIFNKKITLIEGLTSINEHYFSIILNYKIACILNAEIILVMKLKEDNVSKELNEFINIIKFNFQKCANIIGFIINKLNEPVYIMNKFINSDISLLFNENKIKNNININFLNLKHNIFPLLGCVPWNIDFIEIYVKDIVLYLDAFKLNDIDITFSKVNKIIFYNNVKLNIYSIKNKSILIVSFNFIDSVFTNFLLNYIQKINSIIIVDFFEIDYNIQELFKITYPYQISVFALKENMFFTFIKLQNINISLHQHDTSKIDLIQNYVAKNINKSWIKSLSYNNQLSTNLTSYKFRYNLIELARKSKKCIILPEGEELRIIHAASICSKKNIANCILLGDKDKIKKIAIENDIKLNNNIDIINPIKIREKYLVTLMNLRKHKGITEELALNQLKNNIILGTLMLEENIVDGLVAGVINTTADTIRPAIQLIKINENNSLISSIFFMLFPYNVLIYGDCAINKNPTIEQLAEIVIQSSNSALIFGIKPLVAMISYATHKSSTGKDIEKIIKIINLVKTKKPNLIIDGPLQYDAAVDKNIALLKYPNSIVAGKATILIFPDLNTGNTVYKAVQRTSNILAIGPIIQGLRKPVNDLSRGASIEDIVYTIAATSIQATQNKINCSNKKIN